MADLVIASVQNQRIKELRTLQTSKARQRTGRLLIEGVRLVTDAWQAGHGVLTLVYAPELIAGNRRAETLLATLTAQRIECLRCTPAVFATLAETVTPQGIAAVVPLPALPTPAAASFVLLLDRVRDPGNAGTLLRSAEAAGVELVLFCPETVDPLNDKVLRAAMGAHFRLPLRVCADWDAVRAALPSANALYLADAVGQIPYDAVDWRAPSALIVGGEAGGASPTARAMATAVAVPMHGATESLNAGVAGSVILFEAARQRRHPSPSVT